MVFIHGGAFNYGSGSLDFYSPDYLLDENVIVVTINYRLNVLGECIGINVIVHNVIKILKTFFMYIARIEYYRLNPISIDFVP